ncbi:hypothetical protein [Cohnella sp. JJ-181]|uniref:hypothetical protein n=1 Tax=Cohnella rhizoplanae TaxID=2974897 RepID=UPI0022FF6AB6|nr:hypothetical protein [Cohnella sp. JJ-181]CAI6074672.1 hypothetical protein COHCIP112018_02439 [Cohnella sp. JJ-181]
MINKRKPVAKAAPKRAKARVLQPLLQVYPGTNFSGPAKQFRGNIGVQRLSSVNLNDDIESLRFSSPTGSGTVVLFENNNYKGEYVKFSTGSVDDLADFNFDNKASSLIATTLTLSDADILEIQQNGLRPNFGEILKIVLRGRMRRAAKRRSAKK